MAQPLKILAIQFKSLGDAVLLIPALRAIRRRYPDCALHVFVPEAAAPLLRYEPSLTRLWSIPRVRGRARVIQNWPIIRALRAERFDRSVDFGGNDRGAILSLLCGARERLGLDSPGGFLGRRFCYTKRVAPAPLNHHEALRSLAILSAWNIAPPQSAEIEIHADPALDVPAAQILPEGTIICHIGAGRANRQWPVSHWAALYKIATAAGLQLAFTPGYNPREQMLTSELKTLVPEVPVLPPLDLSMFMALLKRSRALITGDTGPMHFAAGLGVPLIALFGPSSPRQWGPVTQNCQILTGDPCHCDPSSHVCQSANHCMAAISPGQVFNSLKTILKFTPPIASVLKYFDMQDLKTNANKSAEVSGALPLAQRPLITVAICTRNRAALLEKTVRSVLAQLNDNVEILIVDNGSTDNTATLATRFSAADPRVKIVHEPQTGLSIARNRALREARGDWVVFLDDDAIAEPGWLAAYQRFLSTPPNTRIIAVGGTVIPQYEIPLPAWMQACGRLEFGSQPLCLPASGHPSECNCAYRRDVTLRVGGFDTTLGHRGDSIGYREGAELNDRLRATGGEIWWLPGAPVEHLVHARRLNLKWFLQKAFNEGRSIAIHRLKSHPGSTRGFYIAGRVLVAPFHCGVNLLVMLVTFPFQNGRVAMGALAHAVSIAGLMFELLRQALKNGRVRT